MQSGLPYRWNGRSDCFRLVRGGREDLGITIPRITLNADFGHTNSFGELSLISLGYGLHQAWIYSVMFAPMLFGGMNVVFPVIGASLVYLVSMFVYGICLIVIALCDQKFLETFLSRRFTIICAFIMVCGTLLSVIPSDQSLTVVLEFVGGVLTGVGSSGLLVLWGVEFARLDSKSIMLNTSVALIIAMLIYAFMPHHVSSLMASVMVTAIPLCEMALLLHLRHPSPSEEGRDPIFSPLPLRKGLFFAAFCIPVALFGFGLGVMRQTSISDIVPALSLSTQFMVVIAAVIAALLIMITAVALEQTGSWSHYFRIIIPAIIVGVLAIPGSLSDLSWIAGLMLVVGYICFEGLIWSFFGELAARFKLSPIFVFGLGRGTLALAALVGVFVSYAATPVFTATGFNDVGVTVLVLIMVMIGYATLPTDREMARLIAPCPLVKIAISEESEDILASRAIALGSQSSSESDETQLQSAPSGNGDESEKATNTDIKPQGALVSDNAASMNTKAQNSNDEMGFTDTGESHEESKQRKGWFKKNCTIIAERYLLSRRETEVLFLLAKGYNSIYIQEKLFISEGTAKTHIRHIYRKLDIHSQQDLMRMVENADQLS